MDKDDDLSLNHFLNIENIQTLKEKFDKFFIR